MIASRSSVMVVTIYAAVYTRALASLLTKQRVVIKKNFQNFAMRTSRQNLISIFLHSIRARNVKERQP